MLAAHTYSWLAKEAMAENHPYEREGPVAANLLWPSERLDQPNWTPDGARVVSNAGKAAAGASSADALIEDYSNGFDRISASIDGVVPGRLYIFSIYARAYGEGAVKIEPRDSDNVIYGFALFGLDELSPRPAREGNVVGAGVEKVGSG